MLFNVSPDKIFMHRMGIDTTMYYPEPKENIASCLAYKNGNFVRFIEHYFKDKYPTWKLEVINLLPKHETAAIFRKSKIFLAFGGPEGFGLPPLEAALCGCKVVGFTGGGGDEYFKSPIFTAVNFMDHIDFIEKLDRTINYIDIGYFEDKEYMNYLRNHYSKELSKDSIIRFFSYIKENFFNI
jgi:glycosyltransferase involved in cell wall biosynthesis